MSGIQAIRRCTAMAATALAAFVVSTVPASAAVSPPAAAATGGWSVTALAGGHEAWLLGVAALPHRHRAVLLQERHGTTRRLVLYRPGRAPRTLMASTHSFGGSLLADARGRLAAAWTTIPTGAGHRRSYFWDGKHVTALTDGSRHASVSMAVDPGGAIALAVSEASPGGRPGQVWVRRGTFDRGLGAPADAGGLQNGALALGQGGAVVVAGSLPGVAGAFAPVTAVSVSSGSSAAFLPAVTLPPAPVAAPNVAATRGPVAGFGPRNTVIAATSTLNCRVGTGDLSEPCSPGVDGSTLQVWLWPASGTAPGAPIVPTTARFAGEPTIVTSGGATWLGWFEAATQRMDTLAVAHVTATGLGTVRRLRLAAAERPGAYDIPTAAPAPGGGVRFYLPATTKRSSALHTVVLSRAGRFGATSTVVAGARWAAPNTWMTPIPATGQVRDLVGWVTADDRHAPIARLAQR